MNFREFKKVKLLLTTVEKSEGCEHLYDAFLVKTNKTHEELQEIVKDYQLSIVNKDCTTCDKDKDACETCVDIYNTRKALEEKDIKIIDDILGLKVYKINLIG